MATETLGVLAHVATLGARLRRRDQPGEDTFVAPGGSLRKIGETQVDVECRPP